jgi:hypothetical protein
MPMESVGYRSLGGMIVLDILHPLQSDILLDVINSYV